MSIKNKHLIILVIEFVLFYCISLNMLKITLGRSEFKSYSTFSDFFLNFELLDIRVRLHGYSINETDENTLLNPYFKSNEFHSSAIKVHGFNRYFDGTEQLLLLICILVFDTTDFDYLFKFGFCGREENSRYFLIEFQYRIHIILQTNESLPGHFIYPTVKSSVTEMLLKL